MHTARLHGMMATRESTESYEKEMWWTAGFTQGP